jgi:rhodanese-related sulfurtransferase
MTSVEDRQMTSHLFDMAIATTHGYRDIRPRDLQGRLADVRIIDVREPSEFTGELGHIPGAELVPLGTVPAVASSWERSADLLIVCRSGGRSSRAAQQLLAMGFRRVMNLAGGMMAYNEAGLPIARAPGP